MTHIFTLTLAGHKKTMRLHFPAAMVENHLRTAGDLDRGVAVIRTSSRIPSICRDPAARLCWEEMKIKMMQPG